MRIFEFKTCGKRDCSAKKHGKLNNHWQEYATIINQRSSMWEYVRHDGLRTGLLVDMINDNIKSGVWKIVE
jgi:hypothetical protein